MSEDQIFWAFVLTLYLVWHIADLIASRGRN